MSSPEKPVNRDHEKPVNRGPESAPILTDEIFSERISKIRRSRSLRRFIILIIAAGCASYLLFGLIFGVGVVSGLSMTPALKGGETALLWRLDGAYKRNDIVAISLKGVSGEYVKRVIGLPGDVIELTDGAVIINGETLIEDFITEPTYEKQSSVVYPLTLAANQYFVLGDHREDSLDSRSFGPVSRREITGRIVTILWRQSA